ncbi:MAG: alpha/beta fold hydrolase [Archangium sp.]|nr:alpha/beta fold hydrolase [Archangium sp.]
MKLPLLVAGLLAGCASAPLVSRPPLDPPPAAEFIAGAGDVRLYTQVTGEGPRGVVWFVMGPEIASAPPYPKLSAALLEAGFATAVLHPRGTGFSDGPRGDLDDYPLFLGDLRQYREVLSARFPGRVFLFGHSAGAALALELAAETQGLAGVVLVNPAWKLVYGKDMGPTFGDYVTYAANFVFRPAALTVDMNRDPSAVAFAEDRAEGEAMQKDPLVVRYFSLRYLMAQSKVMERCPTNAKKLTAPLLMVEGRHDALVDPSGTAELFAAVPGSDKVKLVADEGGHGSSAVETRVASIVEWLSDH